METFSGISTGWDSVDVATQPMLGALAQFGVRVVWTYMVSRLLVIMMVFGSGTAWASSSTCLADLGTANRADMTSEQCTGGCATFLEDVKRGDCAYGGPDCEQAFQPVQRPLRTEAPQCIEGGPLCSPGQPSLSRAHAAFLLLVFPRIESPEHTPYSLPLPGVPDYTRQYESWIDSPTGPPPRHHVAA